MKNMLKPKHSSLMKWSLIVGIVIVMNLFFNYALSLAVQTPDYTAYVSQSAQVQDISNQADCDAVSGQWNGAYCDVNYIQEQKYDMAQKHYDLIIFISLILLGTLSIVGGALVENEVLSLAFSWAGALSLFIASLRYWSDANNLLKVIILAIALGSLIWTAIKKFA